MYSQERILVLDLLKILYQHSDEDHRLTQKEIGDLLQREYGAPVPRRRIKNNMEKLMQYSESADAFEVLYKTRTRKTKNQHSGEEEISKVHSDFGFAHDFTHGELRLIIDSILFSKQIPHSEREKIIEKLEKLSSKHFNSRMNHIRSLSDSGPTKSKLFYNIEELDKAINESKQVSFHYNKYGVDQGSRLVLEPQTDRDGDPRKYLINPYQMVATNGRYYLICNNDRYDNISHYRLDRITDIEKLEEKRKPMKEVKGLEQGLNLPKHMTEHIYMFTGESIPVRLRFNKHFLNDFIDWFGTENITFADQTEDEVTARVMVNKVAMRKWALQYALHVRVLSPESLVEEIKEDINQAWENYQM